MKPLQLLHLEWRRFSPNATFRIITGLYAAFFGLAVFITWMLGNMTMSMNGDSFKLGETFFKHPQNWQIIAWIGSWMNAFLLGFLGLFMTTLEFSAKTLRQGIIFGLTRFETALSKILFAAALAASATAIYLIIGFSFCLATETGLGIPPLISVIGFFLQAFGYMAFGILTGFFIRHTALATLLYFAYVAFFERAGKWLFYLFTKSQALVYLPNSVLENLAPIPTSSSISAYLSPLGPGTAMAITVAYLTLFAFLIERRLAKADL